MKLPVNRLTSVVVFVFLALIQANSWSQQISSSTDVVSPVAPLQAEPFPLQDVQLLDGPFRDAMLRDKVYLLSLDPDRLLYTFRVNYGLSTSNAAPYGGWEGPSVQLRGHIMGHYLSACSLMYGSTGDPLLKARVDYLVNELAKCQALAVTNGFHAGYLSAYPEVYIDMVVTNGPVWAPWYTLHKIMAGLLDAYQVAGNSQALTVLTNQANWVNFRIAQLTTPQIQTMLNTEFGGMNEVLANLYAATGNTNYLQTARAFDHQSVFGPLAAQSDQLDPLHVNTQIPKIIGAAREYQETGVASYQTIASFFWQRVTQFRSFAIGTPGDNEYFFPTNTFPQHLSAADAETCNIYNLLKLSRYLFSMNPDAHIMDYYERGLYNHVLASQDPTEGMMTYFMSLKPGHFKTYSTAQESFWCCVGTGMENHAKYGDTIYFHDANSLYVNLFIPSQLTWADKGLVLRQDTSYPQNGTSVLTFTATNAVSLALKIRYPSWAGVGMTITVNGTPWTISESPGSYITLTRVWQTGDQVTIQIPMALRTEALPDGTASNTVALFYGPALLAGQLGPYSMPASDFAAGQGDLLGVPDPLVPVMVCDTNGLISNTVASSGQTLAFQTANIGEPYNVTLKPFYETHHQRYSVYWNLLTPAQWQQQVTNLSLADAQDIDVVSIGNAASEAAHNLQSTNSRTGNYLGRNWRDASSGGSFGYLLAVSPTQPMALDCTYWGSDSGGRVFDIIVGGQLIATQTLTNNQPGKFFDVQYAIPANLTAGRTNVTVEFAAHPGQIAGGVFGLQMIRPISPGALQSISLNASAAQAASGAGAMQYAQVTAQFQNLTNCPISSSANLALLSSDTSVLTTGPNAQIISVGPGTATITANYLGFTASLSITVTSAPVTWRKAALQHRYQFTAANVINGTNVIDSLNPTNTSLRAVLRGNASVASPGLVLDGTAGTYADLPSGIISNYNGVTIEAWASFGTEPNWAYLFAFGDTNPSGAGQNGFWFTPHSGAGDYRLILSDITGQANEYLVTSAGYLDGAALQHVVAEIDLDNGSYEALYLNGVKLGERSDVPFGEAALHDVHSYIGKSAYTWDPTLVGSVSEVRIYQGRMTAAEVAASYALGPDVALPDVRLAGAVGGTSLVLSWPAGAAPFHLEGATSGGGGFAWQPILLKPQLSGDSFSVQLPLSNEWQMFRLAY